MILSFICSAPFSPLFSADCLSLFSFLSLFSCVAHFLPSSRFSFAAATIHSTGPQLARQEEKRSKRRSQAPPQPQSHRVPQSSSPRLRRSSPPVTTPPEVSHSHLPESPSRISKDCLAPAPERPTASPGQTRAPGSLGSSYYTRSSSPSGIPTSSGRIPRFPARLRALEIRLLRPRVIDRGVVKKIPNPFLIGGESPLFSRHREMASRGL